MACQPPDETMKRIDSIAEILIGRCPFYGADIVDIGCGTGDMARWLARQGATIVAVDKPEILAKAAIFAPDGAERYRPGTAEDLPLPEDSADAVIFSASFHHVPESRLADAVGHCRRVLRPGGLAFFIEPVDRPGAYTEITRLTGDERKIQEQAAAIIRGAAEFGFEPVEEKYFFMERSFRDFQHLVETFVDEDENKAGIIDEARSIMGRFAFLAGVRFEDFRFPSIVRLNVLRKAGI
jgi:ubiquinone/menaquinone biosynthesis C-methylase UbiE